MAFINDLLKRRTAAHKDLFIITLASALIMLLAVVFDAFDTFVHWYVKQEEPAEIEEIIIVIFILSFAFAVFSWRRWREAIAESEKRREVETVLRVERDKLQDALAKIRTLSGLIPICSSCKKIRDDKGFWQQVEVYVSEHTEAEFSHGICLDCVRKLYPDYYEEEVKSKDTSK